jgi:hypothetical protein
MVRVHFEQEATGADGFNICFKADDSFASWWAIVRWNIHYRHWRPLLTSNVPDLFRKVLRRKLWRRSA